MTPHSTYRLQLHEAFGFRDAEAIAGYLKDLGVAALYSSPVFQARAGSTHGYDVVDPTRLSPELGGEEGFAALSEALRANELGLVMDIVPNHMAASTENAWWLSVLENGPSSEYARYFDIVWYRPDTGNGSELQSKVLLPILGGHYGSVLERQELRIGLDEGGFFVDYWGTTLPLDPKTYRVILEQRYGLLKDVLSTDRPARREYERLIELCDALPDRYATDPAAIETRRRGTGELKAEIYRLYGESPDIRAFIDENVTLVNGVPGDPGSFDTLDRLLSEQAYRLSFWRVASMEINYRRFFDVTDLVSMRIEDPEVFEARHRTLREMAADGRLTGLRIDHIDGLHDPQAYLERLQEFINPPGTYAGNERPHFYIVAEKILAEDEQLRAGWPCDGTTGYDFLNLVNGLFVNHDATEELDELYRRFSGIDASFAEIAYQQKRRVMAELFAGDVRALISWLDRLSLYDRHGRDLTQRELGQALYEVIARFHVYRTYIRSFEVSDEDRARIARAIDAASGHRADLERAFSFLLRVLTLDFPSTLPEDQRDEWLAFVMRWQQVTGPIMAKGHEDTALYIYHRLSSLNDVGGEPGDIGISIDQFHRSCEARAADWPRTMNATSTHDTKRSEDVRARINVISELPRDWGERVERWRRLNRGARGQTADGLAPDGNVEYLIYQTLAGAWPLDEVELPAFVGRLKAYLEKANREAKVHTSWLSPNEEYEHAVAGFIDAILADGNVEFLDDLRAFQRTIAWHGALNSLAQVLLKATAPGVPDFYQGTELWDFSLVDPDNRRPVDYALRRRLLGELQAQGERVDAGALLREWRTGAVKLHVVRATLAARGERPQLFLAGDYLPLEVTGHHRDHALAFARRSGDEWSLTVVPRLSCLLASKAGLGEEQPPLGEQAWRDTVVRIPDDAPRTWQDALTGSEVTATRDKLPLAELFASLPVGLLRGVEFPRGY